MELQLEYKGIDVHPSFAKGDGFTLTGNVPISMAETMPVDGVERVLSVDVSLATEAGTMLQHAYTWIKGRIGIYEITEQVELRWIGLTPTVLYPYGVEEDNFNAVKDGNIIRPKDQDDTTPFVVGVFRKRGKGDLFDLYINGRSGKVLIKNELHS